MKYSIVLFSCLISHWVVAQGPEWPVEYTSIENIKYEKNSKASFCKRPVEIIDTIVLHHSETPNTETPKEINHLHLSRGTPADPWYMIAYSYNLNTPYEGQSTPIAKFTVGRPLDIVGAHAGSGSFVTMDEVQQKIWDEGKVTCGKENEEFRVNPSLIKEGKIKANVTSIGVVIIGTYSPFSSTNPHGYPVDAPRYPSENTQDLIARLSCQLQKKYPRIKYLKWHNYYHDTTCPGTIRDYVSQIKILTRKYGCEFN